MRISAPPLDYAVLVPIFVVLAGAALTLLLDLFLPPSRRAVLGWLALLATILSLIACGFLWGPSRLAFGDAVALDGFGLVMSGLILIATALTILMSLDFLGGHGLDYGEYYPLLLLTVSGMLLLAITNDLLLLFLALEVLSLGLYILSGFARGREISEESALKYFLLGSFSLGFLVYGISLVYGATGTTNFTRLAGVLQGGQLLGNPLLLAGVVLILVGLAFKLALVPFHMWTPDVYSGAPTTITAFMSVATKVATFAALVRLVVRAVPSLQADWSLILWTLAVITMLVGNLAAVTQRNIKRLLAYSSIGQAGYVLVGVVAAGSQSPSVRNEALSGVLFYLLVYTFMNLGAFAVVVALARPGYERLDIDKDFAGLGRERPWLAGALAIFMLSLAGIPPTAGFMGKLSLFRAAVDAGYWPLVLVGVLTSVLALGYYLRVIVIMYTRETVVSEPPPLVPVALIVVLAICIVATIEFGIIPGGPLDLAQQALAANIP
ncbi:MAG TPA: NADH-quinone oxidoreductase subunit N [Thermomicrobiales bacterium]|nr:NADH-quinone oxidoreductase subunit N [Thermomicrobiales bacterium]